MEDLKSKNIQLQYQGYLNTPLLWKSKDVLGLKQLALKPCKTNLFNEEIPERLRLGKRVERFVNSELTQHQNIEILLENTQIQHHKITIGEIDCILKKDKKPIHLEIVYKFYLYDPSVGTSEIEHWIGPNRNDTLLKKLNKLKDKQLPLLYNKYTQPNLKNIELKADTIEQRVLFKAQLFASYKTTANFSLINKDCLNGFYISFSEMAQFSFCKFYIPKKTDWLLEVQSNINWLNYHDFHELITSVILDQRAPLCWIKHPNGTLQKFFIVWWE
jgi:hypothetical protein